MIDDCRRRREALERLSQTPDDIQQAGLRLTDKELEAVRMGAGALLESFVLHGRHGDRLASATLRGLLERHK